MLKKRLIIEYDVIEGEMTMINEDEMTFIELLGMIEYAKMMIHEDHHGTE